MQQRQREPVASAKAFFLDSKFESELDEEVKESRA